MALPGLPFTSWWTRTRAAFRTAFKGLPIGLEQFLGQTSRAVSLVTWGVQAAIEALDGDIVPSAQSSDDILTAWAVLLGLPDGQGGYGRLLPTTASGGAATFTGAAGTTYPDGTIATAEDGVTQIKVSGTVQIPAGSGLGSIGGKLVAVTAGSVGNLAAGTVCTWLNPPAGADPTFTLTVALTNGNDLESNADVWTRILQRLQFPPRGGNSTDITEWSEAIAGVVGVYVYPRRSGTGTVDVVITVGGSGTSRVPSTALQQSVQNAVDKVRAAGAEQINVLLPSTTSGHLVRVRVVTSSKANGGDNDWDWGDDQSWTGTPFTVDLYTPGTPATLRLNTTAPQSLKNAIDAYIAGTGTQPRLQVLSTGALPVNVPVGTSKTVTWSDAGGKTTITLDTLPSTWTAPTAGDTVYPYGPVVATIAAGLKALADALGPSKASGFADPYNTWQDTLSINQIVRVAEDAVDGAGVALIDEVVTGGATIDGATNDVEPADNTNQSPELLYLSHVAVTP